MYFEKMEISRKELEWIANYKDSLLVAPVTRRMLKLKVVNLYIPCRIPSCITNLPPGFSSDRRFAKTFSRSAVAWMTFPAKI